jgi:outer membrane autotransporter protein
MNNMTRSGLFLAALLVVSVWNVVQARTVSVAVYDNGRMEVSSGHRFQNATAQACDDGLLFTFSETASPDPLALSRRDQASGSGSIDLLVRINSVCEGVSGGQASFAYRHQAANGGQIGADLSIDAFLTPMILALEPGETSVQTISYQAIGQSAQDHVFELLGDQVSYFGGGSFGTTGSERILARINVAGASFVNPDDPGVVGDDRSRDATAALETACGSESASSELAATCMAVAGATGDNLARVAMAFDPHEMAAVPGAASESGRIQSANVGGRLAALRGGASGMSLNGLSLSMNGMRFDTGLLPANLVQRMNSNEDGSTLFSESWGFFVNGDVSIGKRSRRGKEVGFDFDSWGLTSGIDYRFRKGHVMGVAVGYSEYAADLNDDGGKLDSDTWTVQLYGSFNFSDNLYLDTTLGHSIIDFEQRRVIDLSGFTGLSRQIAFGATDATQWSASAALNYRVVLDSGWQVTPYGQFRYTKTDIDGFSEMGGGAFSMRFPDQDFSSGLFSAGSRVSKSFNLTRSVMTPYLDVAWEYESDNDGYSLQPTLVTSPGIAGPVVEINNPDRNFARLDLGSSWVFTGGTQMFLTYSALLFERDTTRHSVYVGARWEF